MVEIQVSTKRTKLIGVYPKDDVDKALSAYIKGYQYSPLFRKTYGGKRAWDGKLHLLSRITDSFPTGVLDIVLEILKKQNIAYNIKFSEDYVFPEILNTEIEIPLSIGPYTLREHQKEAIKAFLNKDKEIPYRGIFQATTGSGKTVNSITLAKLLDVNTLFLVKGKALKDQSLGVFVNCLGEKTVGTIDAKTWNPLQFTVASVDTLFSRLKNPDTQELVQNYLNSIDFVISDECHRSTSKSFADILKSTSAPIRLGLSGTPEKNEADRDLTLHGLTGPIVHKVTAEDMRTAGKISHAELNAVIISEPKLDTLSWPDALDALIIHNSTRHKLIAKLVNEEYKKDKIIMVIAGNSIPLTENLYEAILKVVDDKNKVRMINGQLDIGYINETLDLMRAKKIRVVISSVITDEGIDVPELNTLFIANGGKSFVKTIQRIGRGLRLKEDGGVLTVFDIMDKTNKYLKKHSAKRLDYYEAENLFTNYDVIDGDSIIREMNKG